MFDFNSMLRGDPKNVQALCGRALVHLALDQLQVPAHPPHLELGKQGCERPECYPPPPLKEAEQGQASSRQGAQRDSMFFSPQALAGKESHMPTDPLLGTSVCRCASPWGD